MPERGAAEVRLAAGPVRETYADGRRALSALVDQKPGETLELLGGLQPRPGELDGNPPTCRILTDGATDKP